MRRALKWLAGVVGVLVLLGASVAIFRDELFRRQAKLPPFTNEFGGSDEVMVPMRDGVKLHAEVFRPLGLERAPTILVRNPYIPLRALERFQCRVLTRYGYACVLQDVRGQMDSEGQWQPIVNERDDGLDTLTWLVAQPFVDGNIAMRGPSYLTCVQLAMADVLPPQVKTLVPSVFGVDFRLSSYERGLFRHDLLTAWATLMPEHGMRLTARDDYLKAAGYRPAMEADEHFMTKRLPWYRELLGAEAPGAAYWQSAQQRTFREIPEKTKVPMLIIAAFFDPFFTAQLDLFSRLSSRADSALIIGPWNHLNMTSGDVTYEVETGRFDPWPWMLEWFDHHLKGKPLTTLKPGTVRTLGPGDHAWRTHDVWPEAAATTTLHLGQAEASGACDGGTLEPAPTRPSQTSYLFDPKDPVPSRGGASMLSFAFFRGLGLTPGPVDQGDSCARADVLTFRGAPLEAETRLGGAAHLSLSVSSTAPDTAFVARLIAEQDGKALLIRENAATLAFPTAQATEAQPYAPGTVTTVEVDFWPIEWVLPKGARLRVDVTSSSFPVLHTHSNRAGPWATQTGADVATQTLRVGEGASTLTLPLTR
ncbi:MAG: CocE/NonD family hydrolase [Myxococcus sp.]|nr:CocE/NonD family hydrolase [Myxococcus sp.]